MLLEKESDRHFPYTKRDSTEISFLNFRIIQSDHGISTHQTNHIIPKIIKPHYTTQDKGPSQFSPFPLDNKF